MRLWLWRFRRDLRAATTAAAAARAARAARAAGKIRIAATTSTGGVSSGVTRAMLRCSALVVLELSVDKGQRRHARRPLLDVAAAVTAQRVEGNQRTLELQPLALEPG
jgi:poly-gamma-glutamate capsule biosynthesis protein CapA/YwtB (metallophosphatase superfamily)